MCYTISRSDLSILVASKKKISSGTTPDSIITPNASGASIGIEKPQENTIDDVLVGDDVLALRIREEDLIKVL